MIQTTGGKRGEIGTKQAREIRETTKAGNGENWRKLEKTGENWRKEEKEEKEKQEKTGAMGK